MYNLIDLKLTRKEADALLRLLYADLTGVSSQDVSVLRFVVARLERAMDL
jgi:hypothetical protein